jgi:hypothetical protein
MTAVDLSDLGSYIETVMYVSFFLYAEGSGRTLVLLYVIIRGVTFTERGSKEK